jgi:hypothetical protein
MRTGNQRKSAGLIRKKGVPLYEGLPFCYGPELGTFFSLSTLAQLLDPNSTYYSVDTCKWR